MMLKWINNLLSYHNENDPGVCPFCGGKVEVSESNIGKGSINFKCTKCKKWAHFDKTSSHNEVKHGQL